MRRLVLGSWLGVLGLVSAHPASAQEPPDSSVVQLPDSVVPGVSVVALDSGQVIDTVYTAHPDSVFRALPGLTSGAAAGPESGVTVWDAEDLLGHPALTLLELLIREADLLPFRYGDYGAPEAVLGAGMSGGRVRVFVDGFEEMPLTGGSPDLSRIGLAGIREVRAERGGGELRLHLRSIEPVDPRPLSRIEAGTGDLNTNLFRGTFLHPRALGGTLGLSLERTDAEGRGGREPGSRQALWFRYAAHRGDDSSLSFDLRTRTNEATLDSIPPSVQRRSWVIRARSRLTRDLVGELYTGSSSISSDNDGLTRVEQSQRQHGARLSFERGFGSMAVPDEPPRPPAVPGTADSTVVTPDSAVAMRDSAIAAPDSAAALPDSAVALPDSAVAVPDSAVAMPRDSSAVAEPPDSVATVAIPDSAGVSLANPDSALAPASRVDPAGGGGEDGVGLQRDSLPDGLSGRLWARLESRWMSGADLPARRYDIEAGAEVVGIGGVAVERRSDRWAGPVRESTAAASGLRLWTDPVLGVSLFGAWDSGVRGSRIFEARTLLPEPDTTMTEPEPDPVPDTMPRFYLSDRTALRAGARLRLGPLQLTGVWHRVETDSVLPLDLLGARNGISVPGDEVSGYEVAGRLRLPVGFDGLSLVGSLLDWEAEGVYRPKRRYTGGFDFHNVYKSGSLELWSSLVVQGRDRMLLPQVDPRTGESAELFEVPFQQNWDFWIQVRVLTVRIFIRSENLTLRRQNQDFPGRLLPQTRTVYGVRWTLRN